MSEKEGTTIGQGIDVLITTIYNKTGDDGLSITIWSY